MHAKVGAMIVHSCCCSISRGRIATDIRTQQRATKIAAFKAANKRSPGTSAVWRCNSVIPSSNVRRAWRNGKKSGPLHVLNTYGFRWGIRNPMKGRAHDSSMGWDAELVGTFLLALQYQERERELPHLSSGRQKVVQLFVSSENPR